jgi:hypothetical protein
VRNSAYGITRGSFEYDVISVDCGLRRPRLSKKKIFKWRNALFKDIQDTICKYGVSNMSTIDQVQGSLTLRMWMYVSHEVYKTIDGRMENDLSNMFPPYNDLARETTVYGSKMVFDIIKQQMSSLLKPEVNTTSCVRKSDIRKCTIFENIVTQSSSIM